MYKDLKSYSPSMYFRDYVYQITQALDTVDLDEFHEAYHLIEDAWAYPILTFGNGGSAALANHAVTDLIKGMGHDNTESYPPQASSLVSNSPLLTCLSNDYGYAEAFAKQIE